MDEIDTKKKYNKTDHKPVDKKAKKKKKKITSQKI